MPCIVTGCGRMPGGRRHFTLPALIIVLSAFGWIGSAGAVIINVPGDFPTIQQAIDAAAVADHDTILVAPGTYVENIDFKGKLIFVTSHFLFDHDPTFIMNTVIDGSNPSNPDTASVVRIVSTEDTSTTIQGFTITGGTGTVWTDPHGAGVYREGGGILTEGTSPTIQYNLITNNLAVTVDPGLQSAGGGGIRSGDGSPRILNNLILDNRGRYGAGIVLNYAGGILRNNVIAHNAGGEDFGGSGLWKFGAAPACTVDNNTIVHNTSALGGGGVHLWQSTMTFRNNTVWGNLAPAFPQVRVNGGTLFASYCDIQGSWPGPGNININPDLKTGFYYTPAGNGCVDAGDPDVSKEEEPDPMNPSMALWPSFGTLRNDIGAYGGPRAFSFERAVLTSNLRWGWAPLEVAFDGYTNYPATGFEWDFGDGGSASGSSAVHTYTVAGLYDVALEIDTGNGSVVSAQPELVAVLGDTMTATSGEGMQDSIVEVTISANNTVPVTEIMVPFTWSGAVSSEFIDYSVEGCRTNYFEAITWVHVNPVGRQYTLKLKNTTFGEAPPLAPGTGPIVKLRFRIPISAPSGSIDTLSLGGYGANLPRFSGWGLLYQPITFGGTIAFVCCAKRGNIDGSANGSVNVSDLTYLVNYLFKSGDAPQCSDEANIDGSPNGSVNVSDLTFLVNYLFKSGPQPSACS